MEPLVATIVGLFKDVHQDLREAVRGLDRDALNWTPAPETNSAAVLVVHTLGSEAEVFRIASNAPTARDRDAEFQATAETADELVALLDRADALLDELAPTITTADLEEKRARRQNPPAPVRSIMIRNYGHAREHLAHIQLTQQLHAQRRTE